MNERLWYRQEAKYWCDALPLGNGRIGAMVFSGVNTEKICLNEDTLWSGTPRDQAEKGRYPFYQQARDLALEGKCVEAQQVIEDNITGEYTESYMPLGNLYFDFEHDQSLQVENYERELDLKTALSNCQYTIGGVDYKRELFVSEPNQVFVAHFTSSQKGKLGFSCYMDSKLKHGILESEVGIELEGLCPSHAVPVYVHSVVGEDGIIYRDEVTEVGIRFRCVVSVDTDGTYYVENGKIHVVGASYSTIIFGARSNYAGFDKFPEIEKKEYIKPVHADIALVREKKYETLKSAHISDYENLYNKFSFIPTCNSLEELPTDERIIKFNKDQLDDGLIMLLLNYGRYLMIASSRKGTQATNMQGIWNEELRAPWSSNYTININTEMNYWAIFACGLEELQEPMTNLIQAVSVTGRAVAKEYYDARGFVAHHNTDMWGHCNPVGMRRRNCAAHDFWPMASGWLVRHLFERYEYTCDEDFLREIAYPIMKEATKFYLDVLVEDQEGHLIFAPSTSPENNYYIGEHKIAVAKTATMTVAIMRDLFERVITSAEVLNIDHEFVNEVTSALAQFPEFQISSDGRLLEWNEEMVEWDKVHRHVSHLYPLYPGEMITAEKTPKLAQACKQSLEVRSDEGTGWSRAWKICLWARLLDGDRAYELLRGQLNLISSDNTETKYSGGGTYVNLFGAHPPFQIDGNFGVLAGMIEMLAQYKNQTLYLLNALPEVWKTGVVTGLVVKQGLSISMEWSEGKITSLKVMSPWKQKLRLVIAEVEKEIQLESGENVVSME